MWGCGKTLALNCWALVRATNLLTMSPQQHHDPPTPDGDHHLFRHLVSCQQRCGVAQCCRVSMRLQQREGERGPRSFQKDQALRTFAKKRSCAKLNSSTSGQCHRGHCSLGELGVGQDPSTLPKNVVSWNQTSAFQSHWTMCKARLARFSTLSPFLLRRTLPMTFFFSAWGRHVLGGRATISERERTTSSL